MLGNSAEVNPGRAPSYSGRFDSHAGHLAVRTTEGDEILLLNTHFPDFDIKIWTNHPTEPDEVRIGVSVDTALQAFVERLCIAHPQVQSCFDEINLEGADLLSYPFMADVFRWATALFVSGTAGDARSMGEFRRLMEFMEAEFAGAAPDVADLIGIELVESILYSDGPESGMEAYLGPALRLELLKMRGTLGRSTLALRGGDP